MLSHADDDAFDTHLKAAQQNEQSAAGKTYGPAFQTEFGGGFAARINECAKRSGGPHSDPFDVLMRLGPSGKVEAVLVRPKTKFSECFAKQYKRASFPKPPAAGYWVIGRMRFSPE
jgi:hypothetical protein